VSFEAPPPPSIVVDNHKIQGQALAISQSTRAFHRPRNTGRLAYQ